MKLSLPTEDTLLSVSALAAGGLAAQVRAQRAASFTVLRRQAPFALVPCASLAARDV